MFAAVVGFAKASPETRQAPGKNHMAIRSIRCPVLGAHVTQVTDLEGAVTRIICAEYNASDGTCRLKKSVGDSGPLAQLLERVSEGTLDTRGTRCLLLAA